MLFCNRLPSLNREALLLVRILFFFFIKVAIKKILWKKKIWSQVIYYPLWLHPPAELSHRGEGLIRWGGFWRYLGTSDDVVSVLQHERPADHCNHRKNIKCISFSYHIADAFLNCVIVLIMKRQIECVMDVAVPWTHSHVVARVCVCVYLWTLQWAGCCCRWRHVSGWGSSCPVWRRSLPPHSSEEFAVSSWSSETRRRKFNSRWLPAAPGCSKKNPSKKQELIGKFLFLCRHPCNRTFCFLHQLNTPLTFIYMELGFQSSY